MLSMQFIYATHVGILIINPQTFSSNKMPFAQNSIYMLYR